MTGHDHDAHFEERAPTYDDWWLGTGRFAGHDRPGWDAEVAQLVSVVAGLEPARVLDVACGTGFLTQHLRGDVTAIDRSAAMVSIAAERMPNAAISVGEAVPLPFPDAAFDRVLTSNFFHHLDEGARAEFLTEAGRVAPELVVIEVSHAFTAPDLITAIGGGDVLHVGDYFVAAAREV